MIIGVPKEIKNNENRVGMTPSGVAELIETRAYCIHTAHRRREQWFSGRGIYSRRSTNTAHYGRDIRYGPDDSKSKRTYRTGVQTDPQRTVVVHLFPFRFR